MSVIALGNSKDINELDLDLDLIDQYVTVGCNFIYKKYIPNFICFQDWKFWCVPKYLEIFNLKRKDGTKPKLVFPMINLDNYSPLARRIFHQHREHIIFLMIQHNFDLRNTFLNMVLPLACQKTKDFVSCFGISDQGRVPLLGNTRH